MLDGQLLNSSFVFFKQKTAYEMRISDWSSDVCSSDLYCIVHAAAAIKHFDAGAALYLAHVQCYVLRVGTRLVGVLDQIQQCLLQLRSEEHTSELQSLMRISYAVFCLKKKKN